jgi:hypothetical protein
VGQDHRTIEGVLVGLPGMADDGIGHHLGVVTAEVLTTAGALQVEVVR